MKTLYICKPKKLVGDTHRVRVYHLQTKNKSDFFMPKKEAYELYEHMTKPSTAKSWGNILES